MRYVELRFAPQLHCSPDDPAFDVISVLAAVSAGLTRARGEFNKTKTPDEAAYEFGVVGCAMRLFFPGMSRYYDRLFKLHPHAAPDEITSMASLDLVRACVAARDVNGLPVVAVDIAGAERGYECQVHRPAFELAHAASLAKTVHAGEGFGPESIWQAIRDCHADRIGHGFHLFSHHLVEGEKNKGDDGGRKFVDRLLKHVSDRRITMEVCLTSNLNTMPGLKLEDHSFRRMLDKRVSICLNTDNTLVSNTTMEKELRLAVDVFSLTPKQLKEIVITGFKRSFYHGSYMERRDYVRSVMNHYDAVARKHGVPAA